MLLPWGGESRALDKVIRCYAGKDGKIIGDYNDNSLINTTVYECELPDGTVK